MNSKHFSVCTYRMDRFEIDLAEFYCNINNYFFLYCTNRANKWPMLFQLLIFNFCTSQMSGKERNRDPNAFAAQQSDSRLY